MDLCFLCYWLKKHREKLKLYYFIYVQQKKGENYYLKITQGNIDKNRNVKSVNVPLKKALLALSVLLEYRTELVMQAHGGRCSAGPLGSSPRKASESYCLCLLSTKLYIYNLMG